MPLFDYICPKCGHEQEELIRQGEEKNFYCKNCNIKMEKDFPKAISFRMTDNFRMGRDKPPEPEIAKKLDQIKSGQIEDPYDKFRDGK